MKGIKAQKASSVGAFSGQAQRGPMYWSQVHRLAFERLRFAVTSRAPLTVFIGQFGTGRTRLLHELAAQDFSDITMRLVYRINALSGEVMSDVLAAFDPELSRPGDAEHNQTELANLLHELHSVGRYPVLVIDDADQMSSIYLRKICALCDQNIGSRPMLKLVFVGRPGLTDVLSNERPDLTGPAFVLNGMGEDDVAEFMKTTLPTEDAPAAIFSDSAVSEVFAQTEGVPARVIGLCNRVLMFAARQGITEISPDHVRRFHDPTRPVSTAPVAEPKPDTPRAVAAVEVSAAETPPVLVRENGRARRRRAIRPGRKTAIAVGVALLCGAASLTYMTGMDRFQALKDDITAVSQGLFENMTGGFGTRPVPAVTDPHLVAAAQARIARIADALADSEATPDAQYLAALDLAETSADAAVVGYARAALSGHARSAYYLGQIYETGEGVPVDLVLAKGWYKMAGSEMRGAVNRLKDLSVEPEGGAMSQPTQLFSGKLPGGAVELVWTSTQGADPSFYRVELSTQGGDVALGIQPVTISAIRLTAPDDAHQWRVIAFNETNGEKAASPWIAIRPN